MELELQQRSCEYLSLMMDKWSDMKSAAMVPMPLFDDDGIIDPRYTRDVLGLCIAGSQNAKLPDDRFGVFRM